MDERSRIPTLFIAPTVLPASAYSKALLGEPNVFVSWGVKGGLDGGEVGGGQEKSAILCRSTFM